MALFAPKVLTAPDINLLDGERDSKFFTPDLWKLEQYEYQLLFMPGEFMPRHPGYQDIQPHLYKNKPLGPAFTADAGWAFWKHKLGKFSYPIPLLNNLKRVITGRIKGEVLAVRPKFFIELDKYYQDRKEFIRFRTSIVVPYRKKLWTKMGEMITPEMTHTIRTWMYVGVRSFWEPQLDAGMFFEPVQSFEGSSADWKWNAGRYFFYSLNEYNHTPSEHNLIEDDTVHKQQAFTVRAVTHSMS